MKRVIMAALAASSVVAGIGVTASPADARPWGYWHRGYHAYWGGYHYYGYGYRPAYYYGAYPYPYPYWRGYYRPYYHRAYYRW